MRDMKPWDLHEDLAEDRLVTVAGLIAGGRHSAAEIYEPARGFNAWLLGCCAYQFGKFQLEQAAAGDALPWLSIVSPTKHFIFQVGTVPVRFRRDDPEDPSAKVVQRSEDETRQLSLALGDDAGGNLSFRLVVDTGEGGELLRIVFLALRGERTIVFWPVPLGEGGARAPMVGIGPGPRDDGVALPPPGRTAAPQARCDRLGRLMGDLRRFSPRAGSAAPPVFHGDRLRAGRLFRGMTLEELGVRVAATRQYMHQLETTGRLPAPEMVEALAAALNVLPSFFALSPAAAVAPEHCHFRKQATTPQAIVQQVLVRGALLDELVTAISAEVELPPVDFPQVPVLNLDDVEAAAEACRLHWRLGLSGPIRSMTRVVEAAGAVVTHFPGLSERVDALSMHRPRPIIVRSTAKDSVVRSRFDLAHEAGHLVMHQGIETGDRATELQAHRFASAFLLPAAAFAREFPAAHPLPGLARPLRAEAAMGRERPRDRAPRLRSGNDRRRSIPDRERAPGTDRPNEGRGRRQRWAMGGGARVASGRCAGG